MSERDCQHCFSMRIYRSGSANVMTLLHSGNTKTVVRVKESSRSRGQNVHFGIKRKVYLTLFSQATHYFTGSLAHIISFLHRAQQLVWGGSDMLFGFHFTFAVHDGCKNITDSKYFFSIRFSLMEPENYSD
ncbi:hypothetical protein GOODEAATRI_027971 [Goodea atripinnis]|uniref:Uncharacterized protein n=1 Tax=Goodea atripinnis TaxID=208336 RepID=A0ABV0NYF4_9TELE